MKKDLDYWKKDLDYWKKKLLSVLKGDVVEKSIEYIPGSRLEKAKGYATGTIRTWSGKEFKKLSSGKWMRTFSGTGERGERQAVRNVMNKIQKAYTMEELVKVVRDNRERFVDESGKVLPVVKEFLDSARTTLPGKKVKETEKKPEKAKSNKKDPKAMDFMANWLDGKVVENARNAIRVSDGTATGRNIGKDKFDKAKEEKKYVDIVDKNLTKIDDKFLYRGTQNKKWLKVKEGDEIPTGMASFSRSEKQAKEFTLSSRIILRYSPPPSAEGIDLQKMLNDKSLDPEWKKRGVTSTRYEDEEEVALRSKSLKVKKISKEDMFDGSDYKTFDIIDVSVVPASLSKSINNSDLMEELSNDFNNPLSNRKIKKSRIVIRRK